MFDQTPRRESYQSSKSARKLTALARIFTSLSIRRHPDETADDIHGPDGLSLLVDSAEPYADIVFVHGLGGGSRKTWDKGNDPQLYWPKEWLSRDPEFKRARIHTFGYHANWVERSESVLNIHDFANALLSQLQASSTIRRGKQVRTVASLILLLCFDTCRCQLSLFVTVWVALLSKEYVEIPFQCDASFFFAYNPGSHPVPT